MGWGGARGVLRFGGYGDALTQVYVVYRGLSESLSKSWQSLLRQTYRQPPVLYGTVLYASCGEKIGVKRRLQYLQGVGCWHIKHYLPPSSTLSWVCKSSAILSGSITFLFIYPYREKQEALLPGCWGEIMWGWDLVLFRRTLTFCERYPHSPSHSFFPLNLSGGSSPGLD